MSANLTKGAGAAPPGAGDLLGAAARAAGGAESRAMAAMDDLFHSDEDRLSDYQRAAMHSLLQRWIETIEQDLRRALVADGAGRLPAEALVAMGSARIAIAAPILTRTLLLHDPDLVAVLRARSDEQRIFAAARADRAAESLPARVVESLLADTDPGLSEAAMAVLIAESRRFDVLDALALPRTDLAAELQYRLQWRVAAALRHWLVIQHGVRPAIADTLLDRAVRAALALHDEGEALEAVAMQLAVLLAAAGRIDDALMASAATEGRLVLFVALLAERSGLSFDAAREIAASIGAPLIVALRANGIARTAAAEILVALNAGRSDDDALADALDDYESIDPAEAFEAIRPWRLDPGYRAAIAAIGGSA